MKLISSRKIVLVLLVVAAVAAMVVWIVRSRPRVAGVTSQNDRTTQAIVVPHHEVGAPLISQALELAKASRPQVAGVVIISPDHYARENVFVTTATQLSQVTIDVASVNQLVQAMPYLVIDNRKMASEHGVLVPIQTITKFYPEAAIVPVTISPFYSQEQFDQLVLELSSLGEDWLWVMSTDFSHNLVSQAALKNHQLMNQVLTDFDYQTLDQLNDEFTDARVPLQVFMRVMQNLEATSWQMWDQGHSSQFLGLPNNLGTSYLIGEYARKD